MIIAAELDRNMNDCVQMMNTFSFGVAALVLGLVSFWSL
jgi:hypothetical protein